jgi:hypothetical protein
MRYFMIYILVPVLLVCGILPVFAQIIINEVMSNAPGRDSGVGSPGDRMEYVELLNTYNHEAIDLSGWTLSDGDALDSIRMWDKKAGESAGPSSVVSGTAILQPGQIAIIVDPEYFQDGDGGWYSLGEGTLVLTVENTTLGNGISVVDPILICDSSGDTVSTFGTPLLDDDFPMDPGDGVSWERIDPSIGDVEGNWDVSSDPAGSTPGRINSNSMPVNISLTESPMTVEPVEPEEGEIVNLSGFVFNKGLNVTPPFEVLYFLDQDGDRTVEEEEIQEKVQILEPIEPGDSRKVSGEIRAPGSGYFELGIMACHPDDGDTSDNRISHEIRVGSVSSRIVLNEIYFYPEGGEGEWVEIYNRSHEPVDLEGWVLTDTKKAGGFEGGNLMLDAEAFAVLSDDSASFVLEHQGLPSVKVIKIDPFPSLDNSGDTLTLFSSGGHRSDRIEYSKDWGGRRGVSIERVNPFDVISGPSNWGSSVNPDGSTPGERNSLFQSVGEKESLLRVEPDVFSPDGDGYDDRTVISYRLAVPKARVLVEIYNILGSRVRVVLDQEESGSEGLVIWDGKDNSGKVVPVGIYIVYLEAIDPYSGYLLREKADVVLGARL